MVAGAQNPYVDQAWAIFGKADPQEVVQMSKEFKRRDSVRYLKLGKKKSKVPWRKPKGRDNKMRLSRRGYPKTVSIGCKKQSQKSYELIHNLSELNNLKTKEAILARVGARKKLEIIKAAKEKKIKLLNVKENKK